MFIARTDAREHGAPYNQQHGSKNHRENTGRDRQPPGEDDAIDISLAALAAAAEQGEPVAIKQSVANADVDETPHIDITV